MENMTNKLTKFRKWLQRGRPTNDDSVERVVEADVNPRTYRSDMKDNNLTAKQQRFVEEYQVDLNATQAAIRVGYSKKTATQSASRLLTNVNVQKALESGREELSRKTGMSAAWVLEELRKRYNALVDENNHSGSCKPLELIGKHFVMFSDKHIHTGLNDGPIETRDLTEIERARAVGFIIVKAERERAHTEH